MWDQRGFAPVSALPVGVWYHCAAFLGKGSLGMAPGKEKLLLWRS